MVWMLRFPCIMRNCDLIRVTCGADDHYGHDDKKKSCTCTCTCILDLELPSMMYRICSTHCPSRSQRSRISNGVLLHVSYIYVRLEPSSL